MTVLWDQQIQCDVTKRHHCVRGNFRSTLRSTVVVGGDFDNVTCEIREDWRRTPFSSVAKSDQECWSICCWSTSRLVLYQLGCTVIYGQRVIDLETGKIRVRLGMWEGDFVFVQLQQEQFAFLRRRRLSSSFRRSSFELLTSLSKNPPYQGASSILRSHCTPRLATKDWVT